MFYQSSWSCVANLDGDRLELTTALVNIDYEVSMRIDIDVRTFIITYARWDAYRSPRSNRVRNGEIQVLVGTDIMKYSTRSILKSLDPDITDILAELVTETVRCATQSEPFVIKHRGHPSYLKYDEGLQIRFKDSCMWYSNIDPVKRAVHSAFMEDRCDRKTNVFNRNKNYHIKRIPEGTIMASASFADSFHEVWLTASLSAEGVVQTVSGDLLRCPDPICCRGVDLINNLIGKNFADITRKEMVGLVGGSQGCIHVAEACYDLAWTFTQYKKRNDNHPTQSKYLPADPDPRK